MTAKILEFPESDPLKVATAAHEEIGESEVDEVIHVLAEVMILHGPKELDGYCFCNTCRDPESPTRACPWPCATAKLIKDGLF